jgi:hypothetical protein
MTIRTSEFLAAFREPNEALHLRGFKPRNAVETAENRPLLLDTSLSDLTSNRELQHKLKEANDSLGIYFAPNVGGSTDASITRFTSWFVENDSLPIDEQHKRLDTCPIQPSIRIETRKSVHAYWLTDGDCSEAAWRDIQLRLIAYFDGDPKIKNPARVMRVPGFNHLHLNGNGLERKKVTVHTFESEKRFTVAGMLAAFPAPENVSQRQQTPVSGTFEYHEDRHTELCQRIMMRGQRNSKGNCDTKALCHSGNGSTGLVYFPSSGAVKCNAEPACDYFSILRAEGLPDDHLPSRDSNDRKHTHDVEAKSGNSFVSFVGSEKENKPEPIPWPELNPAALYGLAGDFVRLIEPHTESDPVALLIQFMAAFGSAIGRGPHFKIEADIHYLNIFAVVVGETGTGRKGTSWGQVRQRFEAVDEEWNRECVVNGLSSGEGLLYHVRDPIVKIKKNRKTGIEEEEIVDQGVIDKRLFAFESELGGALQASSRDGNTLSAVIRNLWDSGTHRSLVKNSPIRTTAAHVTIIGHIVRYELLTLLSECESINGFANRFLWLCARRSKFLPRGGRAAKINFNPVTLGLKNAIQFAGGLGEMTLDDEAWALWDSVYMRLETGRAGFLGKVTQRASPYTLRLACLYALLDCSSVVYANHLRAALALWQYAEDSARYIFGARTGDKLADEVLSALQSAAETGMTQTELNAYFHRNEDSEAIARALQMLAETGQLRSLEERTGKPGRPTKRWFYSPRTNELNELNSLDPGSSELIRLIRTSGESETSRGETPGPGASMPQKPQPLLPGSTQEEVETYTAAYIEWEIADEAEAVRAEGCGEKM